MINLSSFRTSELVVIFIIMIGLYFLLMNLYTASHHGKLLIVASERKFLAAFWIAILVLWSLFLIKDIREYMRYKEMFYRDSILNHILWVEVSILNIIGAIKHSQIRERGVYISFCFFKWSRIKSYEWILPDIVELRLATLFKIKLKINLILNKLEDKQQIDEILKKYVIS